MELAILQKAQKLYGTPEQFFDVAQQMVHEEEWLLISLMEERDVPDGELRKLVLDNGVVREVKNAYFFDAFNNSSWAARNKSVIAVIGGHRFYG